MNSRVSREVYGSPVTAQPVGRLICGQPEANGDLLSQTRDCFEPSCWAVVQCSSDRPVLALSVHCVAVVTPPSPLPASKAHPGELAGAAVAPLGWRVRCTVPDTNCFSKGSHRTGWGLHPVYSAACVLPGLGNPWVADCWHRGRHTVTVYLPCSQALFLNTWH